MNLYSHWAPAMGHQGATVIEDAFGEDIEISGEGSEISAA
jgi:hypothetical protein